MPASPAWSASLARLLFPPRDTCFHPRPETAPSGLGISLRWLWISFRTAGGASRTPDCRPPVTRGGWPRSLAVGPSQRPWAGPSAHGCPSRLRQKDVRGWELHLPAGPAARRAKARGPLRRRPQSSRVLPSVSERLRRRPSTPAGALSAAARASARPARAGPGMARGPARRWPEPLTGRPPRPSLEQSCGRQGGRQVRQSLLGPVLGT